MIKTKIYRATKQKKAATPKALHVQDGDVHAVAIWNLNVMLFQEGKFWIAQGLEIDYVVQGDTPEEAKTNFEKGLEDSIDLNLRMHQNIKGLLMWAPREVLQEAADAKRGSIQLFDQVTTHKMGKTSAASAPV